MANLLVKEISTELLAKVNYAAKMGGETQREYIIRILEESANGPREISGVESSSGVSRVRSGVRDNPGKGKRAGVPRAKSVLRPHNDPPADLGAVDGGIPQDQGVERTWTGPKHMKGCHCKQCTGGK